jgi:hypothetical protein
MTKRRLASFLAASIGNDVPNCTNQAAGERVGVIPSIAAWLAEKVRSCLGPRHCVPDRVGCQVRQFDALEWIATPDGLRRTGSYPVSVRLFVPRPFRSRPRACRPVLVWAEGHSKGLLEEARRRWWRRRGTAAQTAGPGWALMAVSC